MPSQFILGEQHFDLKLNLLWSISTAVIKSRSSIKISLCLGVEPLVPIDKKCVNSCIGLSISLIAMSRRPLCLQRSLLQGLIRGISHQEMRGQGPQVQVHSLLHREHVRQQPCLSLEDVALSVIMPLFAHGGIKLSKCQHKTQLQGWEVGVPAAVFNIYRLALRSQADKYLAYYKFLTYFLEDEWIFVEKWIHLTDYNNYQLFAR